MGAARSTFVISPEGKIEMSFEKVKPEGHEQEVRKYLEVGSGERVPHASACADRF